MKLVRLMNFSTIDKDQNVQLGDTVNLSFGQVVVSPTLYYSESWIGKPLEVRKQSIYAVAEKLSSNLSVTAFISLRAVFTYLNCSISSICFIL